MAAVGPRRRRRGGVGSGKGSLPATPPASANAASPGGRPRLVGYTRVSTVEQAERGLSLAAQEKGLRDYAASVGAELAGVETDAGLSGRTTRRPALQRVLAMLAAGEADGVVVVRLDRLSRSLRDAAELFARADREGWQVHSLSERLDTGSPGGRFVCHVLAAMSQWEREMAADRTRTALAERKRRGLRISGRPPFGWAFDGDRLVRVEPEQRQLAVMQRLAAEGLGSKAIAARLAAEGTVNPRTGRAWFHGTLRDVLRSAARA